MHTGTQSRITMRKNMVYTTSEYCLGVARLESPPFIDYIYYHYIYHYYQYHLLGLG